MKKRPVTLLEVGPRDGLQNEKISFSTNEKLQLIDRAIAAGARRMEVTSFVHPDLVPQMADAEAVVARLPDNKDLQYIGLILNKRGYLRALETRAGGKRGVDQVGCVVCASDSFGQKNQGQTIEEGLQITSEILKLAPRDGMSAQVTLSVAFGCPFEGEVPQQRIVDMAKHLAEFEPAEICIADTIGSGVPAQVTDLLGQLMHDIPGMSWRVHFHDTRHTGVANAWAAYEAGVDTIDAAMAGLGGCPFAPNATGNVATEDVVYMLDRAGVPTGMNLQALITDAHWIADKLGRVPEAAVSRAGGFPVPVS